MKNAENLINTRVSGNRVDEYCLKAVLRVPQFSKR